MLKLFDFKITSVPEKRKDCSLLDSLVVPKNFVESIAFQFRSLADIGEGCVSRIAPFTLLHLRSAIQWSQGYFEIICVQLGLREEIKQSFAERCLNKACLFTQKIQRISPSWLTSESVVAATALVGLATLAAYFLRVVETKRDDFGADHLKDSLSTGVGIFSWSNAVTVCGILLSVKSCLKSESKTTSQNRAKILLPKEAKASINLNLTSNQHDELDEDVELLPISQRPGIRNTGNSCFLAAVMQVLAHHRYFRNLFNPKSNPYKVDPQKNLPYGRFANGPDLQLEIHRFLEQIVKRDTDKNLNIQPIRENVANVARKASADAFDSNVAMGLLLTNLLDHEFNLSFETLDSSQWTIDPPCSPEIREQVIKQINYEKLTQESCSIVLPLESQFYTRPGGAYPFLDVMNDIYLTEEIGVDLNGVSYNVTIKRVGPFVPQGMPMLVEVPALSRFDYSIPSRFSLSDDSPTYQLESAITGGTGHATALVRDVDGSFVLFDDKRVSRLSEEEGLRIINNRGLSIFYVEQT